MSLAHRRGGLIPAGSSGRGSDVPVGETSKTMLRREFAKERASRGAGEGAREVVDRGDENVCDQDEVEEGMGSVGFVPAVGAPSLSLFALPPLSSRGRGHV